MPRNMMHELWPPKPKELERATFTCRASHTMVAAGN
jgi:hypothetical protein